MAMKYTRLTEPLVRDGRDLRPASWDEALDRAAEGFLRTKADTARCHRHLQLLEGQQRDELPRAEAGAGRLRQPQHRQLQPNVTRT